MNQQVTMQRMASDPAYFRSQLNIEVSGSVVRYADVHADWQEEDFRAMDAAWLRAVGRSKDDVRYMRAWLERCRGASKTSDQAISVCWALCFATFPAKGISASGDRDQAKLLRDAIRRLCELNPWLGQVLEVQQWIVRSKTNGAEFEIMSSDAASAYGLLVDFILVDEIANWQDADRAQHFWHVISSTLTKKANCLCVSITNAGRVDSWQWDVREAIRSDEGWYFHSLTKTPKWITEQQLAEQQRLLPPHVYARLWTNVWSAGSDCGLAPNVVNDAIRLPGPQGPTRDFVYIAGLDLAVRRDHAAFVVLGIDLANGELHVVRVVSWRPPLGGDIDLVEVHDRILEWVQYYRVRVVLFDPHQAAMMSQSLRRQGVYMFEVSFTGTNRDTMARGLMSAFNNRLIKIYDEPDLVRDLLRISFAETATGYRLAVPRGDGAGHCDRAIALAICIPAALMTLTSDAPAGDYIEDFVCT